MEMSGFTPTLWVDETSGRVRLSLDGVCSAEGATLQEAADEVVWKVLLAVMTFRSVGMAAFSTLCRPDPELVRLLWELDGIAAAGGDIRGRLFGSSDMDMAA
jgi:hypothetical protein